MNVLTHRDLPSKVKIHGADDPMGPDPRGWNGTTYDSCVGEIITCDGLVAEDTYGLPPRGIAWLVSKENYELPKNVTGITTLKTRWTKNGVMTLTSGIIDPGYSGPLSTAVINFSHVEFRICKGEEFFRTLFLEHEPVSDSKLGKPVSRQDYILEVLRNRANSSKTFLTFEDFEGELVTKIFKLPKIAFGISVFALLVGAASLLVPLIARLDDQLMSRQVQEAVLEGRVQYIEKQLRDYSLNNINAQDEAERISRRLGDLEFAVQELQEDPRDTS